jgi:hypothetical protein
MFLVIGEVSLISSDEEQPIKEVNIIKQKSKLNFIGLKKVKANI